MKLFQKLERMIGLYFEKFLIEKAVLPVLLDDIDKRRKNRFFFTQSIILFCLVQKKEQIEKKIISI